MPNENGSDSPSWGASGTQEQTRAATNSIESGSKTEVYRLLDPPPPSARKPVIYPPLDPPLPNPRASEWTLGAGGSVVTRSHAEGKEFAFASIPRWSWCMVYSRIGLPGPRGKEPPLNLWRAPKWTDNRQPWNLSHRSQSIRSLPRLQAPVSRQDASRSARSASRSYRWHSPPASGRDQWAPAKGSPFGCPSNTESTASLLLSNNKEPGASFRPVTTWKRLGVGVAAGWLATVQQQGVRLRM